MTLLEAALLGLVQGLFMFIPVSSTSHLVLTQHLLISRGSELPPPESSEMILFDLVVHVGTLISMGVVFFPSIRAYLRRLIGELKGDHRGDRVALRVAAMALLAVGVTGVVGLTARGLFSQLFARPGLISLTLVATGFLLWWTDMLPPRRRGLRRLSPWVAGAVGAAQGLALLPGLSRSGTTIAVGLFTGLRRRWAAEFSFLIAFPTILGGTAVMALIALGEGMSGGVGWGAYLVGFGVAAVVGIGALKLVLLLLYRARFRYFAWYVWALAAVVFWATRTGVPLG